VRTTSASPRRLRDPEEGLGLIEIVVSMFLIGLLSIALLPLVIQGLTLTSTNVTRATATKLVNERMELARAQGAGSSACSGLSTLAGQTVTPTVDQRGVSLQSAMTVTCPTVYPGTAKVVVTVSVSGQIVSTAQTLVFVSSS
jgi:Tfp pilus assembly protein PilV